MNPEIVVAVLSCAGTLIGSICGILAANKLTNYRIDKIEERLNIMDLLDRRIDKLETHNEIQDTRLKTLEKEVSRNIDDIKGMKK